jgi:hypothetical protein
MGEFGNGCFACRSPWLALLISAGGVGFGGCRYGHGFQHPSFPPSAWSHVGLVLAHPVPLFTWDILEAFPSARVVLTVRDAEVGGWMCWGGFRPALIQM